MPALNACLKVADIAEVSGVPYVENVAKVAVVIFEFLAEKGENKESTKELCESIANTIIVIDTLVRMQGELGAAYFMGICGEMEGYLQAVVQNWKDIKHKPRGLEGAIDIDGFRDTIQTYRRRVDDLKTDFLIKITGDCLLDVMQMHCLLKDHSREKEYFVIRIAKNLLQSVPGFVAVTVAGILFTLFCSSRG
ncbi:hypothetical protein IW261DRAFT_1564140 [Armillaria novae-zelandiae]|uniref:Uncharacterized protein n=1 Tax=Armillaria novae-zelandiae TaxID=153914 RepID=A0AA39P8E2_9AGAR|nr:hypothetical protein IW261DRAFT_1564140 [Armillaria novae-zelandiae]